MVLRNAFGDLAMEHTNAQGDAHLISGSKVKYRREFNDPTLAEWDVVTGTGMNITAGTGALVITTGTTANAETKVTTKASFSAPFKASFGFKISQKITNQEFYVEVVAENEDGTVDETVVAAWRIAAVDSATTTNARVETRNGGASRVQSGNIASAATQTADSLYEITMESDEVWFHSRVADSTAARSGGSAVRQTTAPDPNRKYRLRYRIKHGATAPASSTTLTASHVTCVDYTELQAEITGGTGSIQGGQAVPVYNAGGSVAVTTTSLNAYVSATGFTVAKVLSAASTNATSVKNAGARLYAYKLANTGTTWRYLKFYNMTTAPVVGSSIPLLVVPIPPGGVADMHNSIPITFAAGMSYAITAGPEDTNNTGVAASEIVGHLLYI
jgi:hypothetical protein